MTIQPIKYNLSNQALISFKNNATKSYLNATEPIDTTGLVKPLPPKGHLVKDNFSNGVKYFFKDIAYDMKAIKDGYAGIANDHQLGRLNDVGLKLGGIGIAIYLASKTNNPKARLMEYIGLATFLTVMSIYPKLAINTPAKIKHGFDIDKEYIDDQGRKKSVFQDSNYVPYEMYNSSNLEYTKEDLDKIGDKMGIPRDIVNRHDVIKEQMRKIATQNNTLWMLTAGLATPAITALLCNVIENHVVIPSLEKTRNNNINNQIKLILDKTVKMTGEATENTFSEKVKNLLITYKNKEVSPKVIDELVELFANNLDSATSDIVKKDLTNYIKKTVSSQKESYIFNDQIIENIIKNVQMDTNIKMPGVLQKNREVFIPTKEEILNILKKLSANNKTDNKILLEKNLEEQFRTELENLLKQKCENINIKPRLLNHTLNAHIDSIMQNLITHNGIALDEKGFNKILDLSKIFGEFKINLTKLEKCKSVKFEFTNETMLARASAKLEKTMLKELKISFKEMEKMRNSSSYTKEIIEQRLTEISKDSARYKQFVTKLSDALKDMEIALNGSVSEHSNILDLINAFEHNFNNTAKRLSKFDKDAFSKTINRLVGTNPNDLKIRFNNKETLIKFLDGLEYNYDLGDNLVDYIKHQKGDTGTLKNLYFERIRSRYQSTRNIYYRLLHSAEIFKRSTDPKEFTNTFNCKEKEYIEILTKKIKNTILSATVNDHILKLNTTNNPIFYKDIMNNLFKTLGDNGDITEKGFVTEITKEILGNKQYNNLLERYQHYISMIKNIVGNNKTDFTNPKHILNESKAAKYASTSKSNNAIYDLIGQSPVEFFKNAAKNNYGTQKWLRIVGTITTSVLGVTFLAQLGFGKLRNPQNLKKQVQNDTNK